jgi:hypothetical protein
MGPHHCCSINYLNCKKANLVRRESKDTQPFNVFLNKKILKNNRYHNTEQYLNRFDKITILYREKKPCKRSDIFPDISRPEMEMEVLASYGFVICV